MGADNARRVEACRPSTLLAMAETKSRGEKLEWQCLDHALSFLRRDFYSKPQG
jgi:hypothetical protein